jgi:hypothetical protein
MQLATALQAEGFSGWTREHKFLPKRRFKFDFAFPEIKVAIEVEGGVFTRGRHVRPKGFIDDCFKYSMAAINGWLVVRLVPRKDWLIEGMDLIKQALQARRTLQ